MMRMQKRDQFNLQNFYTQQQAPLNITIEDPPATDELNKDKIHNNMPEGNNLFTSTVFPSGDRESHLHGTEPPRNSIFFTPRSSYFPTVARNSFQITPRPSGQMNLLDSISSLFFGDPLGDSRVSNFSKIVNQSYSEQAYIPGGTAVYGTNLDTAALEFKTTLRALQQTNQKYCDPIFPPAMQSILGNSKSLPYANWERAEWRRLQDMMPALLPEKLLWGDEGPLPDDVQQGELGNCYVMSALIGLATVPERIKKLFHIKYLREGARAGLYCVFLCVSGVWNEILLDDYFPVYPESGKFIFCRPTAKGKCWPLFIEKAWARVMGGYCNTVAGTCMEALHTVTNSPTRNYKLSINKQAECLGAILNAEGRRYPITCSSGDIADEQKVGILHAHAYTVVGASFLEVVEGGFKPLKNRPNPIDLNKYICIVKLRNPWADRDNWAGHWSLSDPCVLRDPALMSFLGYNERTKKGYLCMDLFKFLEHFIELDVVEYEDGYKFSSINVLSTAHPSIYKFEVTSTGKYTVSFSQINPRILSAELQPTYVLSRICMTVFRKKSNGDAEYVCGQASNRLTTLTSFVVDEGSKWSPGEYFLVLVTNWKSDIAQGTLGMHGPSSVRFLEQNPNGMIPLIENIFKDKALLGKGFEGYSTVGNANKDIRYKHEILEDGFGYLHFVNRSRSTESMFKTTFLALLNLEFINCELKPVEEQKKDGALKSLEAQGFNTQDGLDQPMVTICKLAPGEDKIIVYIQRDAPNKIRYQISLSVLEKTPTPLVNPDAYLNRQN